MKMGLFDQKRVFWPFPSNPSSRTPSHMPGKKPNEEGWHRVPDPKKPKNGQNEGPRIDFEWFWTIFHQNSGFLRVLGGYPSPYAFYPGTFGSGRALEPSQKPPKTVKNGSRTSMKSHVFDPKIGFLDVRGPVKIVKNGVFEGF